MVTQKKHVVNNVLCLRFLKAGIDTFTQQRSHRPLLKVGFDLKNNSVWMVCGGMELKLHALLASALVGSKYSASLSVLPLRKHPLLPLDVRVVGNR
jgi:hypothetical protein